MAITTAAAPSLIGETSNRWTGQASVSLARTSSTVISASPSSAEG